MARQRRFRCGARSILDWADAPDIATMTPDKPPPNVQQLLAFYLEAGGSTCAPDGRAGQPAVRSRHCPGGRRCRKLSGQCRRPGPGLRAAKAAPAPEVAILSAAGRQRAPRPFALRCCGNLLENFDGCALKSTATRLVFARRQSAGPRGDVRSARRLGREEDIEGLPFVGRSGQLLKIA